MASVVHVAGYPADLVDALLDDALAHPGVPLAIAGPQGSGKSTLAAQIVAACAARGRRAATSSLDDVYLDRPQRLALARDIHPLLATRGPPGTHDPALACRIVDDVLAGRPTRLPRFDKATDRRLPPEAWPDVRGVDLLVVEGWCLRVPPEGEAALAEPLNALEAREDPDGTWRRHCDRALATSYAPLWARLPRLVWLHPPSFDVVPDWRWEQERALAAARPGAATLDRTGIGRFVQHFERITRQAMRTLPGLADVVVHLDARRRPISVASTAAVPAGAPPTIGG